MLTPAQRICRERSTVPLCSEKIEVYWELDEGLFVWWAADVIEIDDVDSEDVLACAVIRYAARESYPRCDYKVEFLPGRVLRSWELPEFINNNPALSWCIQVGSNDDETEFLPVFDEDGTNASKRMREESSPGNANIVQDVKRIREGQDGIAKELDDLKAQVRVGL